MALCVESNLRPCQQQQFFNMPLIPGKLPPGTCYGTPQQLLEVFSQHLSVTGSDQAVLYTTSLGDAPVVVDPLEPSPRLWVDRKVLNSPILYSYGGTSAKNWVQVGSQTLTRTFTHTLINDLGGAVSGRFCFPFLGTSSTNLVELPPRSMIQWIAARTNAKLTKGVSDFTLKVRANPDEQNQTNPFYNDNSFTIASGVQLGNTFDLYPDPTNTTKPTLIFWPGHADFASKCFLQKQDSVPPDHIYTNGTRLWIEIGPSSSTGFTAGSFTLWVNYIQLQG